MLFLSLNMQDAAVKRLGRGQGSLDSGSASLRGPIRALKSSHVAGVGQLQAPVGNFEASAELSLAQTHTRPHRCSGAG